MSLGPPFYMNDRDNAYLRDMLDAAQEAIGLNFGAFETDRKLALALVQELAIIGEAAGKVSPEVARSASGIPWPKIIGMRNRLDSWVPRGGPRRCVEGRHSGSTIARHRVGTTAEARVTDELHFQCHN